MAITIIEVKKIMPAILMILTDIYQELPYFICSLLYSIFHFYYILNLFVWITLIYYSSPATEYFYRIPHFLLLG